MSPGVRRVRPPQWVTAVAGGTLAVVAGTQVAHALGLATPSYVLVLGALIGLSYGLLAMCLVLVFRTSRVVNFAQPAIGTLAASVLPILTGVALLPYWVAFVLTLGLGFALGALVDLTVVRRFQATPRVVVTLATLGVAVALLSLRGRLQFLGTGSGVPGPPGLFEFSIGPLLVTRSYTGLILATPLLLICLTLFMTRTRYGLAIRASASNPDSALLAGISPRAMTATAWGIAGLCVTVLSVFYPSGSPESGAEGAFTEFGIIPALTAAAIAGMTNLARAVVAGVVLGMLEQVLMWSDSVAPYTSTVLFAVTLVALLVQRGIRGRGEAAGSWAALSVARPLPEQLARLWTVRCVPLLATGAGLALLTATALRSDSDGMLMTTVVVFAVVALSSGLVTSLGGDLSLGQFALAGVGGAASFLTVTRTGNALLGLVAAVLVAGAVSAALAYPGLRMGGLTLTVASAGFAVVLPALLELPALFGEEGKPVGQPVLGGYALTPGVRYFWWTLGTGVLCLIIAWNVWRGGFGRMAVATRDNRQAARSFGIRPMRVRLRLFFVAGSLAGAAGALLVHSGTTATADSFSSGNNALVVLAVVLGGASALAGGPLGTLWVVAIPIYFATGAGTAASNIYAATYTGVLAITLAVPAGAAQLLLPLRDLIALGLGRLHGVRMTRAALRSEPEPATGKPAPLRAADRSPEEIPALRESANPPVRPDTVVLEARHLALSFGNVHAVRDVSFTLREGETVGLIGPNGAGKTTTFEILSGFARPRSGQVLCYGNDITRLPPEERTDLGLVRSFQDSVLFPTMCVLDVIMLALERQRPTRTTLSVLGLDPTARQRRSVAHDLMGYFGLGQYRAKPIRELSTGTRRIVELVCLIALQPRVLLLDEPSSGIAQRETEALGALLARVRADFHLSLVLIEHDIPLVMSLSDRVVAMAEGEVLTIGTPSEVRAHERVIDSYLGGSIEAIQRSDVA
ncbi:ATP-binding cassette domain-containing protein [Streptomyces sp. NPDC057137]|uniref:ABC transporter permease subunit n=1 Tax=Streptomyces sp. NPDC057137 TaxID=3346030 RepID=UPI0036414A32